MTVQIAGTFGLAALLLGLPAMALTFAYLLKRLQTQERLRAIEKGLPTAFDPYEITIRTRRTAIVLIALGVGLASAFALLAWGLHNGAIFNGAALAILPLFIGLGLLLDYRLQTKQRMQLSDSETRAIRSSR
jgi:hypothetical protein